MGTFHSQFDDDKPEKGGSHHTVPLTFAFTTVGEGGYKPLKSWH